MSRVKTTAIGLSQLVVHHTTIATIQFLNEWAEVQRVIRAGTLRGTWSYGHTSLSELSRKRHFLPEHKHPPATRSELQGYLAHKKTRPPRWDHHRALGMVLQ